MLHRTRANTLTLSPRNMTREHHHHLGHAHGREELTTHTVLASLPMHAHAHPPILAAMPVAADGAIAGPAWCSPVRGAAGGSNLGSPVQATRSALAFPAPAAASPSPAAPGPTPARDAPAPSSSPSRCGGTGSVPRRGCTTSTAAPCLFQHVRQAFYKPRLSFHPAIATGCASVPSTSVTAAGAGDSSSWRGGARIRTSSTANAHSAATVSADLKMDGYCRSSSPSCRARSLPQTRGMAPPMLPQLPFDSVCCLLFLVREILEQHIDYL
ncbi:hypothetical protein DFH11DRAFT_259373 [Phellopilus nigrolimitatus]|nr:hypothetical protein DFH11DRAFT_259373 [Phellopilus nigrolimitatus]